MPKKEVCSQFSKTLKIKNTYSLDNAPSKNLQKNIFSS